MEEYKLESVIDRLMTTRNVTDEIIEAVKESIRLGKELDKTRDLLKQILSRVVVSPQDGAVATVTFTREQYDEFRNVVHWRDEPAKKWEPKRKNLLGHVAVDSGTVMIVDPCYATEEYKDRREKFAVQTRCFGGDGSYPVYAELSERGLVSSLRVVF